MKVQVRTWYRPQGQNNTNNKTPVNIATVEYREGYDGS